MKNSTHTPILGRLFQILAPRIGARVLMEPSWGIAGQIVYASGRKRYFRFSSIDLNTLGASEIAKDKDYANFFMKKLGYPTISGRTFFSTAWSRAIGSTRDIDAGWEYAKKCGLPVIVKPNSQSQGRGVAVARTKKSFYRAMRMVFRLDRIALVQRIVHGRDYRVIVLDNRVISAYQRVPLSVSGDGCATIRDLVARKQRLFRASGRDTVIDIDDPRINEKIMQEGLTLDSVLPRGTVQFLLDNANLSSGGDAIDVTGNIHPQFRDIAVRLTRDMGLRLCGVDLMVEGDIRNKPGKYWILEINAAPGLDHYASSGAAQRKIVEDLYVEVLKAMED